MKLSRGLPILGAATAFALPRLSQRAPCSAPVNLTGNPFIGRTLFANDHYGDYVRAAANAISDANLKAKALKVAEVGTFLWL